MIPEVHRETRPVEHRALRLMKAQCDLVQRLYKKLLKEDDCEQDNYGCEIDTHRGNGKGAAHKREHGLSDAVKETHDGVVRIWIHPRNQCGYDDDPHVDTQDYVQHTGHGANQITENEHILSSLLNADVVG